MKHFLALQATYNGIQIALYDTNVRPLVAGEIEKTAASAHIFLFIQDLLAKSKLALADLSCIAVNQGPAPFTTLRVVLASTNGIAFASGIPLVGVNGLTALLEQERAGQDAPTIALLNAFNKDCYYAYQSKDKDLICGCLEITAALNRIAADVPGNLRFIGNGATHFVDVIKAQLASRAIIEPDVAQYPRLESIAHQALRAYQAGNTTAQLEPLYLKRTV